MQAQVSDHWHVGETLLNLYRVVEILGEQESGVTYQVYHRHWHQAMVAKVWSPPQQTKATVEAFRKRCKTWLKLGLHPHLASFYYVRQWQGKLIIFSEYLAAGSLQTWVQTGRLSRSADAIALQQILDIAIQSAWGLDYLHRQGLIHGNLKASNLLLDGQGTVKLTDLHHPTAGRPVDDLRQWVKIILNLTPGAAVLPASLQTLFQQCQTDRPPTLQQCIQQLIGQYHELCHRPYGRQAPATNHWQAENYNNQGVALIDLNRPQDALRLWEKARQVAPHHPAATYNRLLWLWRSRQITETQIRQELDTFPAKAADLVGLLHLERNDPRSAKAAFDRYRLHSPNLSTPLQAAYTLAQEIQPQTDDPNGQVLHREAIATLHYSDDGQYAIWGNQDGSLLLWECRTLQHHRLSGHPGERITLTQFSPDRCYVISLAHHPETNRQTLKLWSRMTGKCLCTFPQLQDWEDLAPTPTAVQQRWSPDSRFFLRKTATMLRIMEVATGACLFVCHGDGTAIALTAQGSQGVTVSSQPRLWDIHRETCLGTIAPNQAVSAIALHPDGQHCVTATSAGEVTVRSLQGQVVMTLTGTTAGIHSLGISQDGQVCLVAGQRVDLWSLETGQWLRSLTDQPSTVAALRPDGKQVLVGGAQLTLWTIDQQQITYQAPFRLCIAQSTTTQATTTQQYQEGITQAEAALARSQWIEAWQQLKAVRSLPSYREDLRAFDLWTRLYTRLPREAIAHCWELQTFTAHIGSIHTAHFSLDGQAFTGSQDGLVKRWHITPDHTFSQVVGNPKGYLDCCDISPSGKSVVTSSRTSGLQQWDADTGALRQTLETQSLYCVSLTQSPDGHYLMGGTAQGELALWDLTTGRRVRHWQAHSSAVQALCFSPDSLYCVSAEAGNTWKRWEIATGTCIQTVTTPQSNLTSIAYSPNGHYLVSTSQDQTLIVWSVGLGQRLHTLRGHSGAVTAATFSRDSHHILSGSTDHTARLWNVLSGDCVFTLNVPGTAVTGVALSPDSRYALTAMANGYGKLWALDWQLSEQPQEGWDEGVRPYLETFLTRQTPYQADAAPTPPTVSWRQRWQDFPWGFLGLWWGLVWALTAAGLDIFSGVGVTPQAYLLAVGVMLSIFGYFWGRQAGNPSVQLGALFASGVLALVGAVDATVRWSSLGAVVWGAIAALMLSGAALGLRPITVVSAPPGLRVCQALRRYWGGWGGLGILAIATGAGIVMEVLITLGGVAPVVLAGVTVGMVAIAQLWHLIRTGVHSKSLIQGAILAALLALTAYKWAVPSYLGILPTHLCTHLESLDPYLARGGNPNGIFLHNNRLPLTHCAIAAEQFDLVERLLNTGADLNHTNADGQSLLILAVEADQLPWVESLIAQGADIDQRDPEARTALHHSQQVAIAQALLDAGADINALSPEHGTPLHWAIASNQADLFQLLLRAGADFNATCTDCDATTPLHAAVRHNRIPMLKALLSAGADLSQTDQNDQTPLEYAQRQNRTEAVRLIEQALEQQDS
jgi:WD40 repeat protein/ankyrin repeat protein